MHFATTHRYSVMAATRSIVLALCVATLACAVHAQYGKSTTPVPILKQINRHNDDGSYSYGYEGADGSFKIETKHPSGEVFGKYGYVDPTGEVREVEYGASKRGFEVSGSGINVPPPTINNNVNTGRSYSGNDDYDDGQYREDPSVYYKEYSSSSKYVAPTQHRFSNPPAHLQQQPQQQQQYYNPPQPQQRYNPPPQQYNPPPQQYNRPVPAPINHDLFRGHPATNFDVRTGSYQINYSG